MILPDRKAEGGRLRRSIEAFEGCWKSRKTEENLDHLAVSLWRVGLEAE